MRRRLRSGTHQPVSAGSYYEEQKPEALRRARVLQGGGFNGEQAAFAYHLLMLFLLSVGTSTAQRQTPGEHEEFIVGYVSKADARSMPGAFFLAKPFARIDAQSTLDAGLKVLLDGFESWLSGSGVPGASKASARTEAQAGRKARSGLN